MIFLTFVIIALCSLIGWMEYNNRKERKSLLNAILSKDVSDMVNLELTDKTEIKAEKTRKHDLVAMEQASGEDFDKAIKEVVGNG